MNRIQLLPMLQDLSDPAYKQFNDRITNCCSGNPSLGIRLPQLRTLARRLAPEAGQLLEEILQADPSSLLQEEHMLAGILIGIAPLQETERLLFLRLWIPGILSWADCDTGCSSMKFMKKNQDVWFSFCCEYLHAQKEFELRFALVALMSHFIQENFIDRLLPLFAGSYSDAYYVRMAQAWALSVCYVRFPEQTLALFQNGIPDPWIQNKAIQKCRESLRVSPADKQMLLQYKKTL